MKRGKEKDKAEDAERQAVVAKIEGEMPYNRSLYVNDIKINLNRSIESILRAGKELLVVQEREGYGEFTKILDEEIGIPHTTAYRFMNAALKAEQFPSITFPKLGQVSKVYTLLEASDEELKKLEQLGLFAGKDMDELEAMPHKELRDLVRDLRDNKEKYVAKELKKLIDEKKDLERMVNRFERKYPEDIGTWVKGMRPQLAEAWENFLIQWRDFVMSDNSVGNDEAQDFMVEFYDRIFADLDSIDLTRYEKTGSRYGRRKK